MKITLSLLAAIALILLSVEAVCMFLLSLAVVQGSNAIQNSWTKTIASEEDRPTVSTIAHAAGVAIFAGLIIHVGPHAVLPVFIAGSLTAIIGMAWHLITGGYRVGFTAEQNRAHRKADREHVNRWAFKTTGHRCYCPECDSARSLQEWTLDQMLDIEAHTYRIPTMAEAIRDARGI